jgi:hypothetical protein
MATHTTRIHTRETSPGWYDLEVLHQYGGAPIIVDYVTYANGRCVSRMRLASLDFPGAWTSPSVGEVLECVAGNRRWDPQDRILRYLFALLAWSETHWQRLYHDNIVEAIAEAMVAPWESVSQDTDLYTQTINPVRHRQDVDVGQSYSRPVIR